MSGGRNKTVQLGPEKDPIREVENQPDDNRRELACIIHQFFTISLSACSFVLEVIHFLVVLICHSAGIKKWKHLPHTVLGDLKPTIRLIIVGGSDLVF